MTLLKVWFAKASQGKKKGQFWQFKLAEWCLRLHYSTNIPSKCNRQTIDGASDATGPEQILENREGWEKQNTVVTGRYEFDYRIFVRNQ